MEPPTNTQANRALFGQAARFLGSGAANAVLTFLLYQALDLFLPYWLAFTLSFAAGILFAVLVNTRLVFKQKPTTASVFSLTGFYLFSYVAGLGILTAIVEGLHVPSALAPIGVLIIMTPVNFFGSRLVLDRIGPRRD